MRRIRLVLPLIIGLLVTLTLSCTLPASGSDPVKTPTPNVPDPTIDFSTPTPAFTPTPTITPTPLPAVRITGADKLLFFGDHEAALAEYQVVQTNSTDPEVLAHALLGTGRVHFADGYYQSALSALRGLVQTYPDSSYTADAYFLLGQTYSVLTRYSEAVEAYNSYRDLRPGLIDVYVAEMTGDALFAIGDYNGALGEYMQAVNAPRLYSDLSLEMKLANTYALVGDTPTALVMYDDIYTRTESDYTKSEVDYYKGQLLQGSGDLDGAFTAYLDAVENYPLSYYTYLGLVELVINGFPVDELDRGIIDYYVGEYGVALEAFDRYLEGEAPESPGTAHYYKGLTYRDMGDYGSALEQWDFAIQNHPESRHWDEAWEDKAYMQWAYLDLYTEAEATLLAFVEASPQHPRAAEFLYDAARLAERDGRLAEAAGTWERISNEYGGSPYVYPGLMLAGVSHYRMGDYANAETVFMFAQAQAVDVEERSGAFFWIGKTHSASGDPESARLAWEQAAAMDPTGYYSERSRDMLIGRPPFTPPETFDLGVDWDFERAQAEVWMRITFPLAEEVDLSGPGNLAADPRFIRGTELWRLGQYQQAKNEFDSLRDAVAFDPADTFRLMNYLHDIGLYRSAIFAARNVLDLAGMDDAGTLSAPPLFNHIRFGAYYSELVFPAAVEYGFHPLFIWSVMRQESLFEGFITSPAGARGLMQIMPSTGADIYYRSGAGAATEFNTALLERPAYSIDMGLSYLDEQRTYFDGDLMAALAAYNAGPGNAAVWKSLAGDDPDLFAEIVRFDETREYLRSIYEIFTIYRRIYEHTP
jgi:soluble lytic murein transglycosylase